MILLQNKLSIKQKKQLTSDTFDAEQNLLGERQVWDYKKPSPGAGPQPGPTV